MCGALTFSSHLFVAHVISDETRVPSGSLSGMHLKINKQEQSFVMRSLHGRHTMEVHIRLYSASFVSENTDSMRTIPSVAKVAGRN